MKPNRLRSLLQQGKPAFGTMIQEIRSPGIVLIFANAGFDFVFVDMEHGAFGVETAADLLKTIRLTGMTALVRVSDAQYPLIARMLDAGAEGIMAPRVETRTQVEYIVDCVRYPPMGKRGLSITKGHNEYQDANPNEFMDHANRENLVILQIERKQAVEDIDDLVSVPGVDIALIGPLDLSVSLGIPMDFNHPEMKAAIGKVVQACQRYNRWAGLHTGNQAALLEWHRCGMQVLTWSTDIDMLSKASAQGLATLRQEA